MKVLGVSGSPIPDSNTDRAVKAGTPQQVMRRNSSN